MRLHIKQAGAMSRTDKADIDTVKLSEADRKKFYNILRDSKVFELPRQPKPHSTDYITFKIEATAFAELYNGGTIYKQIQALIELAKSQKAK
jgi:hypothetical protein